MDNINIKIGVIGIGAVLPTKELTNADLEKMVETSDEWITTRTGIKTRRIVDSSDSASDLGAEAAKKAIKNAGIQVDEVDLIIVATITPDMQFPSTACLIQKKLRAKNAVCFDISAACSGFLYGFSVAKAFISSGMYKNAVVVGSEILSSITDWTDRTTCVLFGDGAGAAVLAPVKEGGILNIYLGSDGDSSEVLKVPGGGSLLPSTHETVDQRQHYIKMQGSEVFKYAVRVMTQSVFKVLKACNLKIEDVKCLIPHQANIRIIEAIAQRLGIARERVYVNVDKYGNMSSASSAVSLCHAVEEGVIKKGDIVVQVAFGSGLTWGATVIEWNK